MVQKEGTVNAQRLVRDFRATMGKTRPIRHHPGRHSFWALIVDKDASILAHFSRPYIGLVMDPKMWNP